MASWQSQVLNSIMTHFARPGMSQLGPNGRLTASLSDIRKKLQALDQRFVDTPKSLHIQGYDLEHCRMWRYQHPHSGGERHLLYFRGGGFCFRTPNTHARLLRHFCKRANLQAWVPDYRLAPEHPFPAGLQDCVDAYKYLLERGIEAHQIIIGGDSAGGQLALATLLACQKQHLPMPAGLLLISPVTDLAMTGDAEAILDVDDPFFTLEGLLRLRSAYIQGQNPSLPLLSPLFGDLSQFPATLLMAGERELLRDDAQRLAEKMTQFQRDIDFRLWPAMPHVFPLFDWLPESEKAIDWCVDWLNKRF
ncbi:alpha/beta hydrolase [Paraferrimonas sedimenticola]|uniref:Alpha/beta hydrolase n=1 Tax=Paraferrimonas sedimenticola TaxID=375674 RepID=A0AA37RUV2_9GAMM|nr:alpha/beta hydrolase [Paraferrimonas sedimenticola]GLP95794.1 alpha/beta hydrolase [Paraferrimonas sedimenticola]